MIIISLHAASQGASIMNPDTLAMNFLQHHRPINRENIFVHTDNWLYAAGDSIWFAAYCLDQYNHKPDLHSQALFVDLVNDNDSVIDQRLLNNRLLKNNGNIPLLPGLPEGNYWLRAYTRNILNADSTKIFVKNIYVLNPGKHKNPGSSKSSDSSTTKTGQDKDNDKKISVASAALYTGDLSIVGESDSAFKLKVSLPDTTSGIHYIFGIHADEPLFCISGHGAYEAEVPKKFFPTGESVILLLDQQLQVDFERHISRPGPPIIISLKADKTDYFAREQVKFELTLTDTSLQPLQGVFSVAVTDNRLAKLIQARDIPSYLDSSAESITSNPSPYIRNQDSRKQDGEIDFVGVSGTILNKKGEYMKNMVVSMFGAQQGFVFGTDTTNEKGRFYLPLLNSQDSFSFQIQVRNLKGKSQDVRIILDSFHFPQVSTPVWLKWRITGQQASFVDTFKTRFLDTLTYFRGKEWLTPVTVTKKKKQVSYDENKRISMFSTIITPDMIQKTGMNPVGDAVMMAHGVHIVGGAVNIGGPSSTGGFTEPLLVVDGAYINLDSGGGGFENSPLLSYLQQIPATLIDFIEIVRPPQSAYYGTRGGNGAIIVNTRNDGGIFQPVVTVPLFRARGYSGSPLYSGPDYDNPTIKKAAFPDLRSTIYWNGRVIPDENGKAELVFFTSDGPTTYTVTIKGVTTAGNIIDKKIEIRRGE